MNIRDTVRDESSSAFPAKGIIPIFWGCVCVMLVPLSIAGQGPKRYVLAPYDARVTLIGENVRPEHIRIRELADGRVVYVDGAVKLADLSAGTVVQLSRAGKGPKELAGAATFLLALRGDSTVVPGFKSLLMIGGEIVSDLPKSTGLDFSNPASIFNQTDTLGHYSRTSPAHVAQDTLSLIQVSRVTGKERVLGKLWREPWVSTSSERGKVLDPLFPAAADVYLYFPDGWIAVARCEPYRVDWWSPKRGWIQAKPLPFTKVDLTPGEREWLASEWAKKRGRRNGGAGAFRLPWRKTYPPFDGSLNNEHVLVPMADGRLLVLRYPTSEHPEQVYDIVNRRGELEGRLTVKEGDMLVGFGRKSVYVVNEDENGNTWLQRHPWPFIRE
jgi:hypothetical protein